MKVAVVIKSKPETHTVELDVERNATLAEVEAAAIKLVPVARALTVARIDVVKP